MSKAINVTWGIGEGDTGLAAFDAALFDAGIANYNLLMLSSVIPEGFEPEIGKVDLNSQGFGHRLYVVMASERQLEVGCGAWAGLGWVITEAEPKRGLFVEHHGHDEKEVIELITKSLNSMVKYRPEKFGPVQYKVIGTKCEDRPVCALVAAVYQSEEWK
jgi:arginine decarboxylase